MPKKHASKRHARTYQCWADMRCRCNNKKHKRYASYGGRGIKVCERWGSYEAFLEDMGLRPDGLSIDRIDNDGDYSPDNCRWATVSQQNKNTRYTRLFSFHGRSQTLDDWAKEYGIPRTTLATRVDLREWDFETALTAPCQHRVNLPDDPEKMKYVPKLDAESAEKMRAVFAHGGVTKTALGRLFGVSRTTVDRVLSGEVWSK